VLGELQKSGEGGREVDKIKKRRRKKK